MVEEQKVDRQQAKHLSRERGRGSRVRTKGGAALKKQRRGDPKKTATNLRGQNHRQKIGQGDTLHQGRFLKL